MLVKMADICGILDGIHEEDFIISLLIIFLGGKRKVLICSKPVAKEGGH